MALAIAAAGAALFVMAPYLSLGAVNGESGVIAAVAAVAFLVISCLAPFLPQVGVVIGFPWVVYALWLAGYFDVVGGWITSMTTWSDPGSGFDGFFLSILLLVVLIIAMLAVYVAVPAVLGIAGGLLLNLPASMASQAWRISPFPLWSRYTCDTPVPQDADTATGDAGGPTTLPVSPVTRNSATTGRFRRTRWSAAHRARADTSLARRQRALMASAAIYLALPPLALLLMFGTALPASQKAGGYALIVAAALVLAGVQGSIAGSVARDVVAWSLPRDDHFSLYAETVDLADEWATKVDPHDLRDGEPLVLDLLDQSLSHMDDAQRLAARAGREAFESGPGWEPPSSRELRQARHGLVRVRDGMRDVVQAADSLHADRVRRSQAAKDLQKRRRMTDDAMILNTAAEVYVSAYAKTWDALDALGAAHGLPLPSLAPWDGCFPPDLAPADLSADLAQLVARANADFTAAARSPGASPQSHRTVVALVEACRLVQRAAALSKTACARLAIMDRTEHSHAGVDDMVVSDLIRHLHARAAAEREIAGD